MILSTSIQKNPFLLRRSRASLLAGSASGCLAIALAFPSHAAEITLKAGGDAPGASSFAAATNWNPAVAPSVGNTYVVGVLFLRTPPDANNYTFGGDSLALNTGGGIIYKGTNAGNAGILTIGNLILNGGYIRSGSSNVDIIHLAGGITVNGTGSYLLADQSAYIVDSVVTGTGALATQGGFGIVFNGASTYTGNLTISTTGTTTLSNTSRWKFAIGASGVNNTITGAGNAILNGAFDIDLTAAGNTVGNSWTLVNGATLAETYGVNFTIPGFTENNNVWTSTDGRYQFSEGTGILSRISTDSDGDGLPDSWEMANFGSLNEWPEDFFDTQGVFHDGDYDDDDASNLSEYLAGTNPTDPNSWPDTDHDGLNDGWEKRYFNGSLAYTGADDPDNDLNTNAAEFAAFTNPASAFSFPDLDNDGFGDGLNDGWEVKYFGSIINVNATPDADPDGDLYSNIEEQASNTDPIVQVSSPDGDNDLIPDGWEVKYFRVGTEDRIATVARCVPTEDTDGDGYSNLAEYRANTNPLLSSSVPSAIAYWRFEEKTAGVVPYGDNLGGTAPNVVLDSSGQGNHLMTWRDYTAPTYTTAVPFATVPLTNAANTASLAFVADRGNLYLTDNVYTTAGVPLSTYPFTAFTIEASFNTNATGVWQVVVSKSGNPINGQSPFSLKIRAADSKLVAGIVDGAGTAKEAMSNRAITTGTWFHAVVTASATEMKLWLKTAGEASYTLEATTAIAGPYYTYAGNNAPWVVGLGKWNNADADPFSGNIDEVRISAKVLAPTAYLVPDAAIVNPDSDNDGMTDVWETTYFGTGNLAETATGDFDGDGTSNLTEFRLGLIPNNGTSRFAATRSSATGTLTWPSVAGLTFVIQRTTTLGAWENVATVVATGTTSVWTDPAPLSGATKVFYRVVLP